MGLGRNGSGPSRARITPTSRRGEYLAGSRPAEVGPIIVDDPAHPQRASGGGWIAGSGRVLTEQSQVNVHDLFAEGREEMLAVRGHHVQDPAVDQCRAGRKGALWAAHPNRLPCEALRLIPRQAMQGMTFRHPEKSATGPGDRSWSGSEFPKYLGQRPDSGGAVPEFGVLVG